MSQRALIITAAAINALVAALAFALYGWTAIGAHVAARSTARASVLIFIVAFARPGLARWTASFPSYVSLIYAFVAAHFVHFVAVAITLLLDRSHELRHQPMALALTVGIGFTLVVISAITVTRRSGRAGRVFHAISTYGLFVIFLLAFAKHRFVPLRAIAILLLVSLAFRVSSMVATSRREAVAGS